ncbi:MAG: DUF4349 domain-containing protein [Thaumarchaeota archaeon]|nr:DUF4349 domain-containing protein [Nitrososphaerota archaeon]
MFRRNIGVNREALRRRAKILIPIIILVAAGITGAVIESQKSLSPPLSQHLEFTGGVAGSVTSTHPMQTTTVTSYSGDYGGASTSVVTTLTTTAATRTMTMATTTTMASSLNTPMYSEGVNVAETSSPMLPDRLVIYTASIGLNVSSVQLTLPQIQQIAVSQGGYAGRTDLQPIPKGVYIAGKEVKEQGFTATITVLIPANRYGEAQTQIMKLGKVDYYSLSTQDVTDQAVDLEARLKNAQNVLSQYNDILTKASRIEDILNIQSRIDNTQERIEVLKAQTQNLQKQVSYATITLSLKEPLQFKEETGETKPLQNPYTAALQDSLILAASALTFEATGIIFLTVGLFPIWILLGVGYIAYRKVSLGRKESRQQTVT